MFLAGIVLFNPEIKRLKENIDSIINQVDEIICVDNCSDNILDIKQLFSQYDKIVLLTNNQNEGIAIALNQIFEWGEKQNYSWILTLDQDSVCPDNLIKEYSKYLTIDKIAILTPIICDRNYEEVVQKKGDYEVINKCITSGSLTNVYVWKSIGGFNNSMFIDYVDFDFCARIIKFNYEIIKINTVSLLHEIGKSKQIKFFNKYQIIKNHSAFRKYYIIRNRIYYIFVYKDSINFKLEVKHLIGEFFKVVLFEKQKCKKIKAMIRGIIDSRKMIECYKRTLNQKGEII